MKSQQRKSERWECSRCGSNFTVYTLSRHTLQRVVWYGEDGHTCTTCGADDMRCYHDPLAAALNYEHARGRQTLLAATYTNYKLAAPTPLRDPDNGRREWEANHRHDERLARMRA